MESELEAICSELAKSIQRESNLEFAVTKLQERIASLQVSGRRSSDCSSDSGYSSELVGEYGQKKEEIERFQRKCDLEKASIRLELSTKLHDEQLRRKALEQRVERLTLQKDERESMLAVGRKVKCCTEDFKSTCTDLRRRLSEEKSSHDNFQFLFLALQNELHQVCSERDNLKYEVVPELRTKLDVLGAKASTYASNKTQELPNKGADVLPTPLGWDRLHRKRSSFVGIGQPGCKSLAEFSALYKYGLGNTEESQPAREVLAALLQDVEAQRDALHSALKSLLDRQEFQRREGHRKMKYLESGRQQLLLRPEKGNI